MSVWCIEEFLSFKSLCRQTRRPKLGERCRAHTGSEKKKRKDFLLFLPYPLCVTQNLAAAPAVAPGQCICHPFVLQKALRFRAKAGVWMEGTLTRFSPEPRAAVHLPLQSGASVMQGDSDETTDRRGNEKDWFPGREHFDWEKIALVAVGVFQN